MHQGKNRQKHSCVPWRLLIVFLLLSLLLGILRIIRPVPALLPYFYGGVAVLYPLATALLCFQGMPALLPRPGSQFWHVPGRWRFCPALLGTGILCFTSGQILQVAHLFFAHLPPLLPLYTHLASYGMYPCFICAILFLPAPGNSTLARLRTLLDGLMIMVTLITLCVYFLLAPVLFESHGASVQNIAGSLSLVADLLLIFCLVLVALRTSEAALRPVVCLLEAAVLLIFISNLSALSETLAGAQTQMSPRALLWLPALFLLTGAARTISETLRTQACSPDLKATTAPRRSWQALCSPTPVLIASVLFIIFCNGLRLEVFPGQVTILLSGGFLLLMLVVLRQLLAVYEVAILQDRLQERNHILHLLNRRLLLQATTDPLTGLPNHRNLVERLNAAVATARATYASCALIFIDIDRFKTVNDRYGHTAGDRVLARFGKLVQESLPPQACVGRWGGEEFVAILPHSEWSAALSVAEIVRSRIDQRLLTGKGELSVTCSLGVASYPQDASTRDGLLMSADQAMYAAKRLGGNQVRSAHEPLVLALGILEAEPEPPASEVANMLAVVDSLLLTLEIRDSYTSQHSRRVSALSFKLALMLDLGGAEAYVVGLGGLLHDLGKIAVHDDILCKGSYLTADERGRMAQHPVTGAEIVARVPGLQTVAAIVRAHHERLDGLGYPHGLRGEEIPLGARIVSVADAYDALTTNRAYRAGCTPIEAVRELLRATGSQFDPQVVATLVRLFTAVPHLCTARTI
ncbi:MAG TPA: diguanylate cyclase [Ktedonobacteraceae bacterium]|jgi:diguanylate cyclase (GGDEF)-like protein/putative nucleotidyltransferase with HDIG domain